MRKIIEWLSWLRRDSVVGEILRLPLKVIPKDRYYPIILGPAKGLLWKPESSNWSCVLGSYETRKVDKFVEEVAGQRVIYDIGAQAGYYSLIASRLVGDAGSVVACEPSRRNVSYLRDHLAVNGCDNVLVRQIAVDDSVGEVGFVDESPLGAHTASNGGDYIVETSTMNQIAEETGLIPDVVKIDVEGKEEEALRGGVELLREHRPRVFVAAHSPAYARRVSALLADLGYSVGSLHDRGDGFDNDIELVGEPARRSEPY